MAASKRVSIPKSQQALLATSFLDQFDDKNASDFLQRGEAPVLEAKIADLVGEFIEAVLDNIKRLGKTDRGNLEDDFSSGEIVKVGKASYQVSIGYPQDSPAAEYYSYVDKGVKGVKSSAKAPNSPYQFKNLFVQKPMLDNLEGWVKRNNLASLSEDQTKDLSALQSKRIGIGGKVAAVRPRKDINLTPERRVAKRIGRAIKWSGLRTTNYLSDPIANILQSPQFAQGIADAISADITIYIRQVQRG